MTVIRSFSSLEHLTDYYQSSFNSDFISVTSDTISAYSTDNQPDWVDIVSSSFSSNSFTHYVYPHSKTIYRKNVHPRIPNVLYKRFWNSLKTFDYVIKATASFVVLVDRPFTQEFYQSLTIAQEIDISKALSEILKQYNNDSSDIEYYLSYIQNLENTNTLLQQENAQLKEQILNSRISTWY